MTSWRIDSPVAIGGLGGSGTRVVAAILRDWGMFLGSDLNPQMDNLWFTLIFKRPRCVRNVMLLRSHIVEMQYRVFSAAMLGRRPGLLALMSILAAAVEAWRRGRDRGGDGRGLWAFQRVANMLKARPPSPDRYAGWGWKEPNTHVYLRLLAACEPRLRYIHVIRHGLDMAFSSNDQQLRLWGRAYDMDLPANAAPTPNQKLAFWILANRRALNTGEWMGPARFHCLRFDDLCLQPEKVLRELAEFVGVRDPDLASACKRVRVPESWGRYRREDLGQFTNAQLENVRKLGFTIESSR